MIDLPFTSDPRLNAIQHDRRMERWHQAIRSDEPVTEGEQVTLWYKEDEVDGPHALMLLAKQDIGTDEFRVSYNKGIFTVQYHPTPATRLYALERIKSDV